jgi:hypothetical protein
MNKSAPTPLEQAIAHDPNLQLRYLEIMRKLAANRSPYFAWEAIRTCIRDKKSFPDWVVGYLGQCADRMCAEQMQSDRAKLGGDVRKTLQWIFGFPSNKPGRGGPFDQFGELLKEGRKGAFALSFAMRIHAYEDPVTARANAANEAFGDDAPDDRTLQRYLREQFQLKSLPLTTLEWLSVIDVKRLLPIAKKLALS